MPPVTRQQWTEKWLEKTCAQMSCPDLFIEYQSEPDKSLLPNQFKEKLEQGTPVRLMDLAWQREIRWDDAHRGTVRIHMDHRTTPQNRFLELCQVADGLVDAAQTRVEPASFQDLAPDPAPKKTQNESPESEEQADSSDLVDEIGSHLDRLIRLTGYRGAAFYRFNEDGSELELVSYIHQALGPIPTGNRAVSESEIDCQAINSQFVIHQRELDEPHDAFPPEARTGICIPVHLSTGPVGTVWVYDRRRRPGSDRDTHIAMSIAKQLGHLIERKLFIKQNSNHLRMSRELRLASIIQPARKIAFNDQAGRIEAVGCCLSRYDVGGDLCEVVPIDDRYLLLAVGDASGNSLPAAMVMTAVRGAIYSMLPGLRKHPENRESPALLTQQLNEMLVSLSGSHQFMSLFLGIVDLTEMKLRFTNAGHPPPLHFHRGTHQTLNSCGLLLGIANELDYEEMTIDFAVGDTIVLFTDGITEALNQEQRLFRQDGIVAAVEPCLHGSTKAVFDGLWQGLIQHQASDDTTDDATALIVRIGSKA